MLNRLRELARRNLSPGSRRWAAMGVDAAIVIESFFVALVFRFAGQTQDEWWETFWSQDWWMGFILFTLFGAAVFVALLHESGVYRSILRYTGIYQGVRVASATAIATGILFILAFVLGPDGLGLMPRNPVPLGVVLVGAVLAYVQLVAVRLYPRVFYEMSLREVERRTRALIVGTGEGGVALAGHIWRSPGMNTQVVGFLSDSPVDVGKQIEGVPVVGLMEEVEGVIARHGADQVILATGAGRETVDRIWRASAAAGAEVKVMPPLDEVLSQGGFRLRELQIEDLLGREPVDIDLDALSGYINGKRVLVTGAAGSIGQELSRQISRLGPSRLVLLDRDESGLFYLNAELRREGFSGTEELVGDVTSPERVRFVFEHFRPEIVFHAAAYKHVPMMELQSTEAIVNNVFGTLNVARCAGAHGVEKFVNVSTDKAVNPANVMGATKRLAEMIVQGASEEYPETVYASVRFGNVLGSRGSVIPTFRQQIEAGGPVTVTHPGMIRYFMTIPEAVSLILQSGAMADRYATYVLEMGRPVSIVDLARKMIEMMGVPNVQVKFTGLRPGEKLKEELHEPDELQIPTGHPMVFGLSTNTEDQEPGLPNGAPTGSPNGLPPNLFEQVDDVVLYARAQEGPAALDLLRRVVPNYSAAELPDEVREEGLRYPPE